MSLTPKHGILGIKPYKAGLSKAKGKKKVLKLSSNETPLGASPKAIKAYKKLAGNLHRYPDSTTETLRNAIAEVHKLDANRIVCGAGSDEIISLLCAAYAGIGDEVIYTEHGFLMYPISSMAVGATPCKVNEKNLKTDVDSILKGVTEKTKIVFVANPNNPTGTYIPRDELIRLRGGLPPHVLLVLDGAYAEYVEAKDYTDGADIVDMGENTVMTRTFSKIYGLAGLRLGWAYCPEPVADILNRIRGPFNIGSPAIAAGIEAVFDQDFIKEARSLNNKELPRIEKAINKLGLKFVKSVCNFYLVEFEEGKKSAEKADEFLMKNGIIARRVDNYGLSKYLRITVGLPEDNDRVIECLGQFLSK